MSLYQIKNGQAYYTNEEAAGEQPASDPYAPFGGTASGALIQPGSWTPGKRPLFQGENVFGWRDGKWISNDPNNLETPGALDWLNMIPEAERASTNFFYEPSQYFGTGDPGREAAQMFWDLHKQFGDIEGISDPFTLARKFYNEKVINDPRMSYTLMNASGDIFGQIARDYLGQKGFADKGITYDQYADRISEASKYLNSKSVSKAFQRNEAGKKSGFGGMVKGFVSSPAFPLMLPAIGGIIGSALSAGAQAGTLSGVGQMAHSAMTGVEGILSKVPSWARGALSGAAKSAITGGNPLTGALTGGLGGLGGMAFEKLGLPSQLGSMLARQGYGAYNKSQAMNRYQQLAMQRQLARMRQRRA